MLGLLVFWVGVSMAADEWREFENTGGRKLEAKVLVVVEDEVRVQRRSDGKEFAIKIDDLGPRDREFLRKWKPGSVRAGSGGDLSGGEGGDLGNVSGRLYPKSRKEIRATVREIEGRDPVNGVSREQQDAINSLNVYRYLCGVQANVEAKLDLVAKATEAAVDCKNIGGLSHSIGHFTYKCNLSGGGNILRSVTSYITDNGANNRPHRGHRRWCLNAPMKYAAFGSAGGSFSAMWCMNSEGKRAKDSCSYPGKGFFPKERVHGNAWSLYLPGSAPAKKDLSVEVYRLPKRPERAFGMTEEIPGRKLPVEYVSTAYNSINFEPAATW